MSLKGDDVVVTDRKHMSLNVDDVVVTDRIIDNSILCFCQKAFLKTAMLCCYHVVVMLCCYHSVLSCVAAMLCCCLGSLFM